MGTLLECFHATFNLSDMEEVKWIVGEWNIWFNEGQWSKECICINILNCLILHIEQ